MNINDYILKQLKTLRLDESVEKAQKLFKNHFISHFPVVENNKLVGSFSSEDIQNIEKKEDHLVSYSYLLNSFFADEKTSILELLKISANNHTTIIPVLDIDKNYIGYYDLRDVLEVFSSSLFFTKESEILIIETLENNYSISRVAQIIEANGGKLLGLYISSEINNHVQITLKIVSDEINEIIQTFRRYDYKIVSAHEHDMYLEDLKSRSDYLQKYLEI